MDVCLRLNFPRILSCRISIIVFLYFLALTLSAFSTIGHSCRPHPFSSHGAEEGEGGEGVCQRAGGYGSQVLEAAEVGDPREFTRREM